MRIPRSALAVSLAAALAVGCGGTGTASEQPAAVPDTAESTTDTTDTTDTPDTSDDGATDEAPDEEPTGADAGQRTAGFDIHIDGSKLEVVRADGDVAHGYTLEGVTFQSFLVHPASTTDTFDAVALALEGERPVLYHVSSRAGDAGAIDVFPDHLQPLHEVDASPPALAWTPDGRSLVWTEPTGDGVVLRSIGWEDGPGTGRTADDNASFALDAPADVHVDGFEVDGETWTLLLRDGSGSDPIEVVVERQGDGALALPAS